MAEKAVYSLTSAGEREFEKLMSEIACKPINIFLDFNAVIVNLDSLTPADQKQCLDNIEANVKNLKGDLEENMARNIFNGNDFLYQCGTIYSICYNG